MVACQILGKGRRRGKENKMAKEVERIMGEERVMLVYSETSGATSHFVERLSSFRSNLI